MGGLKHYLSGGGFSHYLYKHIGDTITEGRMTGKVVTKIDDNKINHSGLPFYSNTSDFYVKISEEDGQPEQIRIFKNRRALLDLDWNHPHPPFKKGELHIHECVFDKNGHPRRLSPRAATPDEIKKYRALIKKVNPNVKF